MMEKLDDMYWSASLKVKKFFIKVADKKYIEKFVWYWMFRKYKNGCKQFCGKCERFDLCQAAVKANYKAVNGEKGA